ncbi:MAG: bifunctional phosphoribosylaminoimidazolecarboxamide formyltransferase/IMP cyclohydrolase [Halobacteriota archaeon]
MRILGLTSSTASHVFAVDDRARSDRLDADVVGVASDRDAPALEDAEDRGIEATRLPESDRDGALADLVVALEADVVAVDDYMPIMSEDAFDVDAVYLNVHPSLLPAFRTADPWRAALEAGVEVTGATVHVVTEDVTEGPIVTQEAVSVEASDTRDSLRRRLETAERRAFLRAIQGYVERRWTYEDGEVDRRETDGLPRQRLTSHSKAADLRYGENPHQDAAFYRDPAFSGASVGDARQHQGKEMSYNNYNDADAALSCVRELPGPACVVVKHANPCGAAVADTAGEAYERALATDEMSAFGGIVAFNAECTAEAAEAITESFKEVVVAPEYEDEALEVFEEKDNLRVLETRSLEGDRDVFDHSPVEGGVLVQRRDDRVLRTDDIEVPTERKPTDDEIESMVFGYTVVKHVKSNAIVLVDGRETVGVGAGQMSRVDAVELARDKADKPTEGSVLASDAFFPFRDNIDVAAEAGVEAVVQPGGSVNDDEVVEACDEHGIAMAFTGFRCFRH